MCSETSPRISFSNDLSQDDVHDHDQTRRDTKLLESNSDFEFSICSSLADYESSLADELFADGKILPAQVHHDRSSLAPDHMHRHEPLEKISLPSLPRPSSTATATTESSRKNAITEVTVSNSNTHEKPQSKSFWGFKRSSSLNYDINKSLCSLPLLLRSNSTGSSVPNPKKSTYYKDFNKHNSQKLQSNSMAKKLSASTTYVYTLPQKPPLKKSYSASHSHSNSVKISPVLNVPPPYIAKGAANLFGLGLFLRNGKEKNRK